MKLSVGELFRRAGVDWETMEQDEVIDISDKNISIKSLNANTGEIEFRKVLSLVRKEDSMVYNICYSNGKTAFKASPNHRVYCKTNDEWEYKRLCDITGEFIGVNDKGKEINLFLKRNSGVYPILDFEVENNNNYFSNNILSHNTTPGGNALPFYASIRLKVRKKEDILEGTKLLGIRMVVKAVKNKVACPMKEDVLDLLFDSGFDPFLETIDFGITYELIGKAGAWYTIATGERFKGKNGLIEHYKQFPKELEELRAKVLEKIDSTKDEIDAEEEDES